MQRELYRDDNICSVLSPSYNPRELLIHLKLFLIEYLYKYNVQGINIMYLLGKKLFRIISFLNI